MTFKYENVYVEDTATVAGKLESEGPLRQYFDKVYSDFYDNCKTFEQMEIKMCKDVINILLEKTNKNKDGVELIVGGDLSNQLATYYYGISPYKIPSLGVYSACASTMEEVIISSCLIDSNKINNAMCVTTSHNLASEKQFRNPTEYGAPKPKTATFTSTGGASIFLTNKKTGVKVSSSTIGKVIDIGYNDVNNMGACMAPAAADTIFWHLKNNNESVLDYDLILTGDLGKYGKEILKDYINKEYNISLTDNYNDCGVMLYDLNNQKEITAGGSGTVCSALVNYSYIYKMLKEKKLNKVLLVTTGALFNPTFIYQKQNVLGIAHAVCLEVVK